MVDFLQPGKSTIQDLTLLLFSAIFYLLIVLDAFWHENGFQLLGTMVIGALNLLQSIVYAVGPCDENETSTSFQFLIFLLLDALQFILIIVVGDVIWIIFNVLIALNCQLFFSVILLNSFSEQYLCEDNFFCF